MEKANLILRSGNDAMYIRIHYGEGNKQQMRVLINQTPESLLPANIIGLKLIVRLGLHVNNEGWRFEEPVSCF
jgi:hypothetical protein